MTLGLSYLSHLKAPRVVLGFAAGARGTPFLVRGVVSSRRKTSRVVIARTIIDGSTSDIMESSGVLLARRLTGTRPPGNKAILAAQEMLGSAFRQNFDNVPPRHIMDSWCGNGATRLRARQRGRVEYKKAPDWPRDALCDQTRGRSQKAWEETQARMNKQYSGQSWRAAAAGVSAGHGGAARPRGGRVINFFCYPTIYPA
jgi:hypothetical protein